MRDALIKTLLVAGLILQITAVSSQENAPNIKGKWFTTIIIDGRPQPLWIEVKSLKPGEQDAVKMSYSKPRQCYLEGEYGGFLKGWHFFYVNDQSCGSSFMPQNATMKFTSNSDGQLKYELIKGGSVIESALADRQ